MQRSLGNKDILLESVPAGSFCLFTEAELLEPSLSLPGVVGLWGEGPSALLDQALEVKQPAPPPAPSAPPHTLHSSAAQCVFKKN